MPLTSVLHICKVNSGQDSDAGQHLLTLLPGLQAHGLACRLLVLTDNRQSISGLAEQLRACGVMVDQMVIRPGIDPAFFTRLAGYLRAGDFDAVHTHLFHADLHGVIGAGRAGIRNIFMTAHNDDPAQQRFPARIVQRFLWGRIRRGIASSEAARRYLIGQQGAPSAKMITIPYGLDSAAAPSDGARAMIRAELGLPPQAPVFGSVGRLIASAHNAPGESHFSESLRAFWQVSRQVPDAHYVIVGDGPQRVHLQSEAEGYGISHRVHFLGARPPSQTLMAAFDALVMPARPDGVGLLALEAMAARVPVIAPRVGAFPEIIIDGETGYLTPPGDMQAMMQAMLSIGAYPAEAHQMGLNARARFETEFSAAKMIDRTFQVYQESSV